MAACGHVTARMQTLTCPTLLLTMTRDGSVFHHLRDRRSAIDVAPLRACVNMSSRQGPVSQSIISKSKLSL